MDWVEKLSRERADDAKELRKRPPNLKSRIDAYLNDELTADEMDVLSKAHGEAIDQEKARREQAADQKMIEDQERARILWAGGGSPQEQVNAHAAAAEFRKAHPNFRVLENGLTLMQWLADEKLGCTLQNLELAYDNLKAMGALIEKTEDEKAIDRMSADEYRRATPELADTRIPPIATESVERALNSLLVAHPEYIANARNYAALDQWLREVDLPMSYGNLEAAFQGCKSAGLLDLNDAVVSSGATKLTDFGQRQGGYPRQPTKPSFKKLLRDLTADEYKQRILDDPNFEASVDLLEK